MIESYQLLHLVIQMLEGGGGWGWATVMIYMTLDLFREWRQSLIQLAA